MSNQATKQQVRDIKASVARSRITWLESLSKPSKAERDQLARERETLARNS